MQIGLSQECCLFYLFCLKSSLWSLDLPCLLATTSLDSFSLFYLPNKSKTPPHVAKYPLVKVTVLVAHISRIRLSATPWTVAHSLLCPWGSPDKNIGVGCHFLLQGIFPTQGSNLSLPHCRQILYSLSHQGSPNIP